MHGEENFPPINLLSRRGQRILLRCLKLMLRPIAGYCLRHSIKIQRIVECTKEVLLEAAEKEAAKQEKRISAGYLSAMTGIHRKDVARIYAGRTPPKRQESLVARVMGRWQTNKQFTTSRGKPRVLSAGTNKSEFAKLVFSVSADLKPGAVLRELERICAVEHTAHGVRLVSSTFKPSEDLAAGFEYLGSDVRDLMQSIEENVFTTAKTPHFHIRTEFDNLTQDSVPRIQEWMLREGTAFHRRAMQFISKFDRDINPKLRNKAGGARVKLVGFSLTETREKEIKDSDSQS